MLAVDIQTFRRKIFLKWAKLRTYNQQASINTDVISHQLIVIGFRSIINSYLQIIYKREIFIQLVCACLKIWKDQLYFWSLISLRASERIVCPSVAQRSQPIIGRRPRFDRRLGIAKFWYYNVPISFGQIVQPLWNSWKKMPGKNIYSSIVLWGLNY
jgi:hypothetical protein